MKRNYYIFKNGEIHRKDNSIQVILDDNEKKYIPIEDVESFYIMGENSINTKFINFMGQKGIILHFFNYYGFYTGSFYPKESLISGLVTVNQVEHYTSTEKRISLSKEILKSASYGIYRNLRYYHERGKDLKQELEKIEILRDKLDLQNGIEELMAIEGNIRKNYYLAFDKIINQEIEFDKRTKRPPENIINTMISYVNSLVYTTVLGEIYHTHLNPTISFLHEPGTRRFSLSLDIAEIFKPLIGDRMIFSMLNKNQITEKDFVRDLNYLYLKENARKEILAEYDKRLNTTIKHKELGRSVTYRYLIRLELYKIVKHVIGEKQYKGFKIWW